MLGELFGNTGKQTLFNPSPSHPPTHAGFPADLLSKKVFQFAPRKIDARRKIDAKSVKKRSKRKVFKSIPNCRNWGTEKVGRSADVGVLGLV